MNRRTFILGAALGSFTLAFPALADTNHLHPNGIPQRCTRKVYQGAYGAKLVYVTERCAEARSA